MATWIFCGIVGLLYIWGYIDIASSPSVLDPLFLHYHTLFFLLALLLWFDVKGYLRNRKLKKENSNNTKPRAAILIRIIGPLITLGIVYSLADVGVEKTLPMCVSLAAAFLVDTILEKPKIIDKNKTNSVQANLVHFKSTEQGNFSPGQEIITYIAGVTYENHQEEVNRLYLGADVLIIPEPENPFDENAISVNSQLDERKIGYLPKELAKAIGTYFKCNTSPEYPVKGKVVEIRNKETDHVGVDIRFKVPTR